MSAIKGHGLFLSQLVRSDKRCFFCTGRLISSSPSIARLGRVLLEELLASIYQKKGKAAIPHEQEKFEQSPPAGQTRLPLGEPYFATMRKLQAQVAELQEANAKLRREEISKEEDKMKKIGNLMGHITGRIAEQVTCFKFQHGCLPIITPHRIRDLGLRFCRLFAHGNILRGAKTVGVQRFFRRSANDKHDGCPISSSSGLHQLKLQSEHDGRYEKRKRCNAHRLSNMILGHS